jgi:hypothetical protein
VVLSIVVAFGISYFIFDGLFLPSFFWPAVATLAVIGLCVLSAWLAGRKIISESPASILQQGQL